MYKYTREKIAKRMGYYDLLRKGITLEPILQNIMDDIKMLLTKADKEKECKHKNIGSGHLAINKSVCSCFNRDRLESPTTNDCIICGDCSSGSMCNRCKKNIREFSETLTPPEPKKKIEKINISSFGEDRFPIRNQTIEGDLFLARKINELIEVINQLDK